MKYYSCYIINGNPFNSLDSLKKYMREQGIKTATITVDYRRQTNGKLDITKHKIVSVRIKKHLP